MWNAVTRAELHQRYDAVFGYLIEPAGAVVTLLHQSFFVDADPGQMRQVLGNVLRNAVQALDGAGQINVYA